MKKKIIFFESISVIVGTIVGAGVLGIPFVFAQSGFLTGVFVLFILGLALLFTRLMLGELTLRTEELHQLTGYTELYIGKWAKHLQGFILIVGIYGTLLAYMIGQGKILSALFSGSETTWTIIFYLVFSFLVLQGIDMVKRSELLMTILIFLAVTTIGVFTASGISTTSLINFEINNFFIPYGVVLFSLSGLVSVPQVRRILKKENQESMMKKIIIWAGIIPPIIYFVFAFIVIGITGGNTTEVATVGLGEALGPHMIIIGNVFAFFAISTSFLTLSLALRGIFKYDYSIPPWMSSSLVITVPLILFAIGFRDFIYIISVIGALTVGVNGYFTIWAFWKARKHGDRKPEYSLPTGITVTLSVFFILLFSVGLFFAFI